MFANRVKSSIKPAATHELKTLAKAVFDSVQEKIPGAMAKAIEPHVAVMTKAIDGQETYVRELVGKVLEKELPGILEKALGEATRKIDEVGAAYEKALNYFTTKDIDRAIGERMASLTKEFDERVKSIREEHAKTLEAVSVMVKSIQVILPNDAIAIKMLPAEPPRVTVNNNVPVPEVKNIMPEQPAPQVTFTAPEQKPPDVIVQIPQKAMQKSITYDNHGRPAIITETPV